MEPEISVNTKVTVPFGRRRLIHSYSRSGRIGRAGAQVIATRDTPHASMDWSRPRVRMRPSSPHKICGAPNSVQRQSCAGASHPPQGGVWQPQRAPSDGFRACAPQPSRSARKAPCAYAEGAQVEAVVGDDANLRCGPADSSAC